MNIGSLRELLFMTRNREIQARILNTIHKKQQYNKIHRAPNKAKRPPRNNNNNGNTRRALF
jgi:hypothetical protein